MFAGISHMEVSSTLLNYWPKTFVFFVKWVVVGPMICDGMNCRMASVSKDGTWRYWDTNGRYPMYSVLSSVLLWVIILTLSVTTAFTDISLYQVFCADRFIFSFFHYVLVNVNYVLSPVCLSSVTNACAPYSGSCNFWQFFYSTWYVGHPLTSTKNVTEIVPGEPLHRGS